MPNGMHFPSGWLGSCCNRQLQVAVDNYRMQMALMKNCLLCINTL